MTRGPGIARTLLPKGFKANGVNCGVRRYRPDLGILISEEDAVGVGMFTLNECRAAPVLYSQKMVPSKHIRAIITNSGQANAATGPEGVETNLKMAEAAARSLGCNTHQVLTASTGVIGQPMEIEKIVGAVGDLVHNAGGSAEPFALAILTTDLVPKTVTTTVQLSGGQIRITGIAKGSGMIHPNMATMLGYLLTDVALPLDVAQDMLTSVTNETFNMISVDGDTSTNDAVFLMANGASGVKLNDDADYAAVKKALLEVSKVLSQAIARDGEGATKLVEVNLKGSHDLALARKAARGITVSPLIKTAIHGADPNWGRILARLGAEGIPAASLDKLSLKIQGKKVMEKGRPVAFDRGELSTLLRQDLIKIQVDLFSGDQEATAWGCDLSKKYVEINTEYS
ncbi:MAG: bifunctional glutamate N-acetyltransferase/amino-acid acetyltransferase ArgJ [Deltaproteobacteria bacterium]|nr:bifunctional glutamate N-acetyltransferase/amino-acid acetyltransferase ArgJ [Deltaproteobacteria bacterium]